MHNATVQRNSTLIIVGDGPTFDLTVEPGGICVIAPTKEDAQSIIASLVNAQERADQRAQARRRGHTSLEQLGGPRG